MSASATRVEIVDWAVFGPRLIALRTEVFVHEQGVPEALEVDGRDDDAVHAAAIADGQVVGTGRLLAGGHVGRMAVRRDVRGRGVGARILALLVDTARRRGDREVHLAAQVGAMGFYRGAGFVAVGGEFLDAGLPHRNMHLSLVDG